MAALMFELAAQAKEVTLSKPTADTVRYDYVADWDGKLYRVQVKYGGGKTKTQNTCYVNLRRPRKRCYWKDEIDALAVYLPQVSWVCWFGPEVFAGKTSLQIRYGPMKRVYLGRHLLADNHVWWKQSFGM